MSRRSAPLSLPAGALPAPRRAGVALVLLLAAAGAAAQYKVVQPDGSVTYTDRPPAGAGRVTTLGRGGAPQPPDVAFPPDLRQAVQRYPVVVYTAPDCAPCDTGRQLLVQRGVPYTERRIVTEEDAQALERLTGGRTVPSLTIGAQPVRGLSESDWAAYLDVAGYPRESRLPRGWQPAAATPLADRPQGNANRPAQTPAPLPQPEIRSEEAPPAGIRF